MKVNDSNQLERLRTFILIHVKVCEYIQTNIKLKDAIHRDGETLYAMSSATTWWIDSQVGQPLQSSTHMPFDWHLFIWP